MQALNQAPLWFVRENLPVLWVQSLTMKTKLLVCVGGLSLAALVLIAAAPEKKTNAAEAARLNNLGCAYMNQQLFEKAQKAFAQALALDPTLTIAKLNEGVALAG